MDVVTCQHGCSRSHRTATRGQDISNRTLQESWNVKRYEIASHQLACTPTLQEPLVSNWFETRAGKKYCIPDSREAAPLTCDPSVADRGKICTREYTLISGTRRGTVVSLGKKKGCAQGAHDAKLQTPGVMHNSLTTFYVSLRVDPRTRNDVRWKLARSRATAHPNPHKPEAATQPTRRARSPANDPEEYKKYSHTETHTHQWHRRCRHFGLPTRN